MLPLGGAITSTLVNRFFRHDFMKTNLVGEDFERAKYITDLRYASFEKFNNIVVSVSSGALALTIAFRDKFKAGPEFVSALFTSVWILFIFCVLLGTLQSLKGAYIAKKAAREFKPNGGSMEVKPIPFFVWTQRIICWCFCFAIVGVGVIGLITK